jgi:hypothetical protein
MATQQARSAGTVDPYKLIGDLGNRPVLLVIVNGEKQSGLGSAGTT